MFVESKTRWVIIGAWEVSKGKEIDAKEGEDSKVT